MTTSWQAAAAKKREAISALIPAEWRVSNLPSVKEQVDVTDYIEQYLSEEELGITESNADQIVEKTTSGTWTAEKVTRAFCHRAAMAHQLVPSNDAMFRDLIGSTDNHSSTAFMKSSLTQLSQMQRSLTPTLQNTGNPLVHSMVSQFR